MRLHFLSILALSLLIGTTQAHAVSNETMKPAKSPSVLGKWRGELKGGNNDMIGKAYLSQKVDTSVLHTWTGPKHQTHCRYQLIRTDTLKDNSVLYREISRSRACKPMLVKAKRVGLKFIEITRYDPGNRQDLWQGKLKISKTRHKREKPSGFHIPLIGTIHFKWTNQ